MNSGLSSQQPQARSTYTSVSVRLRICMFKCMIQAALRLEAGPIYIAIQNIYPGV